MSTENGEPARGRTSSGSCGCTGGGHWIFYVIAAGLVGLYVIVSILS